MIIRPTAADIEERLRSYFEKSAIVVEDESHLHAGHAGSKGGAGHYRVKISSDRFNGLTTIAKHRLVYDSVSDWMPHRVHALSIEIL